MKRKQQVKAVGAIAAVGLVVAAAAWLLPDLVRYIRIRSM